MTYKCEHCDQHFNTNSELYRHKHTDHKTPTIVLVNHRGHESSIIKPSDKDVVTPLPSRKRKIEGYDVKPKKKLTSDRDVIVDSDHLSDDSDDGSNTPQPKIKILGKRKRIVGGNETYEMRKKKKIGKPQFYDQSSDLIIDSDHLSDDSDDDSNTRQPKIKILRKRKNKPRLDKEYSRPYPNNLSLRYQNYKKLYEKCLDDYQNLKKHYDQLEQRFIKVSNDYTDLESRCNDKCKSLKLDSDQKLLDLTNTHKKELNDMQLECEQRIEVLNNLVNDLKENENENFHALSKAIFNCSSIEEISMVQKLLETGQYKEVIDKHLRTIQNLFLGLSMNVIPICNPIRTAITDKHRKLIEKVQEATSSSARKELKENTQTFVNLFTIISDSLDLLRRTYSKYGSRDEQT